MTAPGSAPQWVWLARIRRPQGRKGEVFAEILTDFPEKFAERRRLWLLPASASHESLHHARVELWAASTLPREVELTAHWLHKGGIVLHFSGVQSISDAEALSGKIVAVPLEERAPLADDEVYVGDLIGCTLTDVTPWERSGAAPAIIGEIEDVDRTAGPVPLLIVRSAAGEVLVPFAKSFLRKLDLKSKHLEMALPEGLVDLNAPEKP